MSAVLCPEHPPVILLNSYSSFKNQLQAPLCETTAAVLGALTGPDFPWPQPIQVLPHRIFLNS